MALTPGTKLAHYEVVEAIGKGGMGEVYRARDTKLGRDVAIKVLPDELANDRDRLQRFEREARVLAQLNHTHIATLHGLEEEDGRPFLVMELVEGETLSERIARGPLDIDEAKPLFIRIAEGLEAAHEKGIVHRDLKPGNIKIGPDGKPKILDFGLAKAFASDADAQTDAATSQSPTLTKGTALGAIMGTASYMSPEQARGKPVDKRTDIWAFGCCLYEALTGRKAFDGETVADVLGSVVKIEPPLDRLPSGISPPVRDLIRRMLVKNPLERLRDVGDARIALKTAREASVATPEEPRSATLRLVPWAIAAVAVVAAVVSGTRPEPASITTSRTARFTIELPSVQRPAMDLDVAQLVIARDGSRIAWIGSPSPTRKIYTRALDGLDVSAVPGTDGVQSTHLFLSSDGGWVAFMRDGALWKIPIAGGVPVKLFQGDTESEIWPSDWEGDEIVLSLSGSGLVLIPSDGGEPVALTSLDPTRGEFGHSQPYALPGGRGVLYTRYIGNFNSSELVVLDRRTSSTTVLLEDVYDASYVDSGHVVWVREGTLFAAPFDVEELQLRGPPVRVLENIQMDIRTGRQGQLAVSESGTVVYIPDRQGFNQDRLAWVSRDGEIEFLGLEPGDYDFPSLSPDGKRIALAHREHHLEHVATYDLERDVLERFTFEGKWNTHPFWSPDGARIAFGSGRLGALNLFVKSVEDRSDIEHLQPSMHEELPTSWSPDGTLLAYTTRLPGDQYDVLLLPADGSGSRPIPLLTSAANETHARFCPAGGSIAYVSTEEGRAEVYLQDISPDGTSSGRRVKVSPAGGWQPVWSRDGTELFFRSADGHELLGVDVQSEPTLRVGNVRVVLEGFRMPPPDWWADIPPPYDVAPDGRFLMVLENEPPETVTMVVMLDGRDELKRLAPPSE